MDIHRCMARNIEHALPMVMGQHVDAEDTSCAAEVNTNVLKAGIIHTICHGMSSSSFARPRLLCLPVVGAHYTFCSGPASSRHGTQAREAHLLAAAICY